MTAQLHAVRIDAREPQRVGRFWAGVLGWDLVNEPGGDVVLQPADGTAYRISIHEVETPKRGQNRIHFDLTSSSPEAMDATVARALELGGQHIDIGQGTHKDHVVLADPEGNELCVIEAGNNFLSNTGVIGAINCDGSQAVGYFWSKALDWPLVWDQDEETAIQSPDGGSKITWSGPPLMPRDGRDRLRLDLVLGQHDDLQAETDRLVELGATEAKTADTDGLRAGMVALIDPDGNEFRVLTLTSPPLPGSGTASRAPWTDMSR
ncbi:VOC family protein [Knoellia sp. S7-12]|uniref:VOC family protein n=1 Tax=Knoellia sp. S7-12 TaxID=3126698 RepID=UPI0033685386